MEHDLHVMLEVSEYSWPLTVTPHSWQQYQIVTEKKNWEIFIHVQCQWELGI